MNRTPSSAGDDALGIIGNYADTFEEFDAVVAPSGSCVGSVRHQHAAAAHELVGEALARRAEAVAA